MHVLQGTFRPDRHADGDAIEAPGGAPPRPTALKGKALSEWKRMTRRLNLTGALSAELDGALYQYCQLFAETESFTERSAAYDATIAMVEERLPEAQDGQLSVLVQEITKLRALQAGLDVKVRQGRMAQRQFLVEFGLTPAARSRVKPAGKPAAPATSKLSQFMTPPRTGT